MSNRYDKIKGDCLTHCLAQLLDIDYRQVPYFAKESRQAEWVDRLEAWSLKKGYVCDIVNDEQQIKNISVDKIIAVGPSPKQNGNTHAVLVDKDMRVIYDPSYRMRKTIKTVNYVITFREL